MVFLIHTELRCTVNHTTDLQALLGLYQTTRYHVPAEMCFGDPTIRPTVCGLSNRQWFFTTRGAVGCTAAPSLSPHCLAIAWFNIFVVFCSLSSSFLPLYHIIPFRHLYFFLQCSHFLPSARTQRSDDNWACIQGWLLILLFFLTPSWRPQETTSTNYLLSQRRGRPLATLPMFQMLCDGAGT